MSFKCCINLCNSRMTCREQGRSFCLAVCHVRALSTVSPSGYHTMSVLYKNLLSDYVNNDKIPSEV